MNWLRKLATDKATPHSSYSYVVTINGDTSLFIVIHDSVITMLELNSDLSRIKQWAFQWKMNFNPNPNKQAQEVIFSRKLKKFCHPSLRFNNNNVSQASSQKHLGLTLDNRLTFDEHKIR